MVERAAFQHEDFLFQRGQLQMWRHERWADVLTHEGKVPQVNNMYNNIVVSQIYLEKIETYIWENLLK